MSALPPKADISRPVAKSAKCQKSTSLTISIFALCLAQDVRQQGPLAPASHAALGWKARRPVLPSGPTDSAEAGPALTTQVKGLSQESYENFRATSTAFRPPNANEFDTAASIRMARASFGT